MTKGEGRAKKGARQTVTLQDVANAAGVSVATVSFVANNRQDVRLTDATRARVQQFIDELGYRPNAMAKNLASGGSKFIGLVADAIATTPFAGQIIHGAQDEAWKHGYVLLVANTEENAEAEREAIAMMLDHQVRGILYSTWFHRETVIPELLRAADFVLVDCFSGAADARAVVPDERQGGRTATELLLEAGHRRIAFVNATTPSPAVTGRLAGYRDALEAAGVAFDASLVLESTPDQEGGYDIADAVLALGVEAAFLYNDRQAMGFCDAVRRRGLSIPDDISIVGFDNQEVIAAHLRPPLTTVALPHYELGAAGVRVLLGLEASSDATVRLDCPPVVRESVAPATG